MTFPSPGRSALLSFKDSRGLPVQGVSTSVPAGYTVEVVNGYQATVVGPPADAVLLTTTAPDGTSRTWPVRVLVATTDLQTMRADVDLKAPLRLTETVQGAAYTLALADESRVVVLDAAAAVTLTIPTNASVAFPVGALVEVFQAGAGQVTVTAAAGVVLRAVNGTRTQARYATATLRKRAADEWVLSGEVIP